MYLIYFRSRLYNVVTCYGLGSVTNNSTRVRIGYRIYSLRRFTAAHITITENILTLPLVASLILQSELHCTLSLTRTNSEDQLACIVFPSLTLPATMETFAFQLLVTVQHNSRKHWPSYCWLPCNATVGNSGHPTVGYHVTQQYWSGKRIHGTVVATVT
jgi:hypothetical protein